MKPFWPALPRMIRTRNTGRRRTDRRTKQMRVVNKFRLSTLCGQSDRGEIRHALIGGLSNCGERFMPESRLQSGVSAVLRKIRKPRCKTILRRGFVRFKDCGFLCGCNWEPMFLRFWGLCIKPDAFNAARNQSSGNPRGYSEERVFGRIEK